MHKVVGERFKISGFPTLKYFEKGEEKYTLPQLRNRDKIVEFMHKWVTRCVDFYRRSLKMKNNANAASWESRLVQSRTWIFLLLREFVVFFLRFNVTIASLLSLKN